MITEKLYKFFNYFKKESEKCVNHPSKDALSFCYNCKKFFCEECLIEGPKYYYCKSSACMETYSQEIDYSNNPRFCPKCISETTNESAGDAMSFNLVGDKLVNEIREECPICGSIVLEKIGSVFGRKGTYKIIWLNENKTKFISRKMKSNRERNQSLQGFCDPKEPGSSPSLCPGYA